MSDDATHWVIRTPEPVLIERRRLEDDDELAPGAAIVGAFLEGRLIARSIAESDWAVEDDRGLFNVPRVIEYVPAESKDGSIRAELYAVIPAAEVPREPWEAEPEMDAGLLLGVVVRLANERSQDNFANECLDHFLAIINQGAEPVVDRLLRSI